MVVSVTPVFRIAMCLLLPALGCAYSFRGSLPPYVRTVEVEQFRSSVAEYGLETEISSMVTERIVTDGRLSVVTENPDARISGRVSSFARSAEEYTGGEQVQLYRMDIRVEITMEDLRAGGYIIHSESVSEWVLYDPTSETMTEARDRLIRGAAGEIVQKCLSGW
jgi:hypothetical protein